MKTLLLPDFSVSTTTSKSGAAFTVPVNGKHAAACLPMPVPRHSEPVSEVIERHLNRHSDCKDEEDAFFVGDLGDVRRQHRRWTHHLPRIEPFYAVKCNPDPQVLALLVSLGVGFDCASKAEIATMLEMGVDASRIIYANPCKQSTHIRFACDADVRLMTFDNAEELFKVKRHFPHARLVLRILTDDSRSVCKLGSKFGAPSHMTASLLDTAKQLDLNVVGVSFHVGSGCFDASAFREAVMAARRVFDEGKRLGFDFSLLDVGGGFPGNTNEGVSFEEIAKVLGKAVDEFFPPSVRVIAEPGRFFVASAFTLAVHITARRTVHDTQQQQQPEGDSVSASSDPMYMYYVNDGVYGSFNCILFDHAICTPKALHFNEQFVYAKSVPEQRLFKCSVWGPTCDSMDCITKTGLLPLMDVGDWIYFDNMGAYTMCAASTFNGFKKSSVFYTDTEQKK